jgi:hypothetical protein
MGAQLFSWSASYPAGVLQERTAWLSLHVYTWLSGTATYGSAADRAMT